MIIKMNSFGDHFNPLLGIGVIWTSMSNGHHKSRLSNKNFRSAMICAMLNYHTTQNRVTRELNDKFVFKYHKRSKIGSCR